MEGSQPAPVRRRSVSSSAVTEFSTPSPAPLELSSPTTWWTGNTSPLSSLSVSALDQWRSAGVSSYWTLCVQPSLSVELTESEDDKRGDSDKWLVDIFYISWKCDKYNDNWKINPSPEDHSSNFLDFYSNTLLRLSSLFKILCISSWNLRCLQNCGNFQANLY